MSCRNNPKIGAIQLPTEDSQFVHVKLVDSLGSVELIIPKCYDTSFEWTDYSDCGKLCDKIKYRYQPKYLPISKESGYLFT